METMVAVESDLLILGSIITGLAAIIGAWIMRPRERILERGDNPHGHGFSFSGNWERTDGTSAKRLRLYNGRMVVEWSDGKMTDIPRHVLTTLLAYGPRGSCVIR